MLIRNGDGVLTVFRSVRGRSRLLQIINVRSAKCREKIGLILTRKTYRTHKTPYGLRGAVKSYIFYKYKIASKNRFTVFFVRAIKKYIRTRPAVIIYYSTKH